MKKIKKEVKINLATFVYFFLRFVVLLVLIRQIMLKDWIFAFTCLYTLVILSVPKIMDKKFKIKFPSLLEITIYLFIFAAEIMGEVGEYYITVSWWDNLLHTISGFALTGVGIFFVDLLNNKPSTHISLSPLYVTIASFCFSMTILVLWEFVEFGNDILLKGDMQKDTVITTITSVNLNEDNRNIPVRINVNELEVNGEDWIEKYGGYIDIGLYDTMNDLLDGFLGANIFSFFGYFYLKKRNEKSFVRSFIPKLDLKLKENHEI